MAFSMIYQLERALLLGSCVCNDLNDLNDFNENDFNENDFNDQNDQKDTMTTVHNLVDTMAMAHYGTAWFRAHTMLPKSEIHWTHLIGGAALLQAYVAANITGVEDESMESLIKHGDIDNDSNETNTTNHMKKTPVNCNMSEKQAIDMLRLDGEDVVEQVRQPQLLVEAIRLLGYGDDGDGDDDDDENNDNDKDTRTKLPSIDVWRLRALIAHQTMLERTSETLRQRCERMAKRVHQRYRTIDPKMHAIVNMEVVRAKLMFYKDEEARHALNEACEAMHFYPKLTGKMGRRTRFQTENKALLVVDDQTNISDGKGEIKTDIDMDMDTDMDMDMNTNTHGAKHVELDSDVLLTHITLDDEDEATTSTPKTLTTKRTLTHFEVATILANIAIMRARPTAHSTSVAQLSAFVERVVENKTRTWAQDMFALFLRSSLEFAEHHKQMRAVQQLEEVMLAYKIVCDDTNTLHKLVRERTKLLWISFLPPVWDVKSGIAKLFTTAGLHKSALDIYSDIGMYEGEIETLMWLGRKDKAEELIMRHLNEEPTPKLYCLLGDIHDDRAHYEAAWELSMHKYPRAQRSIARWHRKREEFKIAIEHFRIALAINPAFPNEWYEMGWCGLQIDDFETAALGFSRAATIDPEYGDAWNNLAVAHIKLKNKKAAFSALEQAVRLKFDSWKSWENYLLTALDVGEWQKAINAFQRTVQYKRGKAGPEERGKLDLNIEKERVDGHLLSLLTTVVVDQIKAKKNRFLIQRFGDMLRTISGMVGDHPAIAESYSRLFTAVEEWQQAVDYREKQVQALASAPWSENAQLFRQLVDAITELVSCYEKAPTSNNLYSGRLIIENILLKGLKIPAFSQDIELLKAQQIKLRAIEPSVPASEASAPSAYSHEPTGATSAASHVPKIESSYLAMFQ